MQVLGDGKTNKVVTVAKADLVDCVLDVLDVELSHVPDLFELAVDHHSIGVAAHSDLPGEVILFSFV